MVIKKVTKEFSYLNLKGNFYEIGKQQAEFIKKHNLTNFSGKFDRKKSAFSSAKEALEFYDSYIPGIMAEFEGFADAMQVKLYQLTPVDFPNSSQNNCSQMAFLPQITEDNHIYVARTYDWHYDDEDNRLVQTQVEGKYGHLGFSTLLTGRADGLNDQGLSVIMAGGGAWKYKPKNNKAFNFAYAIRHLLDSCKTTNQAVDTLIELPVNTSTNYLIADKRGKTVIVEGIDCEFDVRETEENYLYGTNYYRTKKLNKYNQYVIDYLVKMNKKRDDRIEEFAKSEKISKENIIKLLSKPHPEGIATPHYNEWFGVLWSIVFDITEGVSHICLGTPGYNEWKEYSLDNTSNHLISSYFVDAPSGYNQ
ncbi:MAG: C45 family autoproteolytic acyltransferase/hydrolase [Candidatus Kariarchaeaceae archaeon]|jgi:predicted choloylglycine hydrolase